MDNKNFINFKNILDEPRNNKTLIVCGGKTDKDFAIKYINNNKYKNVIGVDRGAKFLFDVNIKPTHLIGDFDSLSQDIFKKYKADTNVDIRVYNPIKNASDSELAIKLAIEIGSSAIHIIGATGKRLDHTLANIECLTLPLEKNIPCKIIDKYSEIRLIDKSVIIEKEKMRGKYISIFPFNEKIKKLSLEGFKYNLNDFELSNKTSLTLSNELVQKVGKITFENSVVVLIISND